MLPIDTPSEMLLGLLKACFWMNSISDTHSQLGKLPDHRHIASHAACSQARHLRGCNVKSLQRMYFDFEVATQQKSSDVQSSNKIIVYYAFFCAVVPRVFCYA